MILIFNWFFSCYRWMTSYRVLHLLIWQWDLETTWCSSNSSSRPSTKRQAPDASPPFKSHLLVHPLIQHHHHQRLHHHQALSPPHPQTPTNLHPTPNLQRKWKFHFSAPGVYTRLLRNPPPPLIGVKANTRNPTAEKPPPAPRVANRLQRNQS